MSRARVLGRCSAKARFKVRLRVKVCARVKRGLGLGLEFILRLAQRYGWV
jgi:hypothetical protein